MQDHTKAMKQQQPSDCLDLSGSLNRAPWAGAASDHSGNVVQAAARFYGCPPERVLPLVDLSDAMEWLPFALPLPRGRAALLAPDCSGWGTRLGNRDWTVVMDTDLDALKGAELAAVMNPGLRHWSPEQITELAQNVGFLIVDESNADSRPDLSIIPALPQNALVLRDMRPFWGVNMGFAIGHATTLTAIPAHTMPRQSAQSHAAAALSDHEWARSMTVWLAEAALHLDQIMTGQGALVIGGTHLFRLYQLPDAQAMQARLARNRICTRLMRQNPDGLRLGLPATRDEFARLRAALARARG